MITLQKLAVLRAVRRTGSFNRAAQDLLLSQSVVSQHVHDLEVTVGAELFVRSPRGVRPTAAGELLDDYAARVLDLVAEAERAVGELAGRSQQLTVAATPGVSAYVLPPRLEAFRRSHPTVGVHLRTALTHEVTRDVLGGRSDLGVVEGELLELDSDALGRRTLRTVSYHVVAGPEHPWRGRTSVTLDELLEQPFVHRVPTSRARGWLEDRLGPASRRLRVVAELDDPSAVKHALLDGSGVSVLPDYTVERDVRRGELLRLRLDDHDLTRPLLAVWDARVGLRRVQAELLDQLSG